MRGQRAPVCVKMAMRAANPLAIKSQNSVGPLIAGLFRHRHSRVTGGSRVPPGGGSALRMGICKVVQATGHQDVFQPPNLEE
jgi:hypothetical protein